MLKKILTSLLIATFTVSGLSLPPMAHAQPLLGLPEPGKMVSLSQAFVPAMIKGVTVNKDNPFQFDFIVDVGQDKLAGEALKAEGDRLIKYFLASLAIPQQDLWVNLSPYEKDKTVPEALGQTDMGRDLLAQDYILKQVTASLIYPEKSLGKSFWDRVYAKSQELYGNTQIPVNTFNKVWITADQAEVFEHGQTAFVTKSHLKVMLEEDYLATQTNTNVETRFIASHTTNRTTQNIIRDIILPELEKEVNEGKNFANLRQIFNSLILASWYKNNLKDALLTQVYANQSTVKGIDLDDKTIKEEIYKRYLQAYKKGVFNFVKEDTINNQIVPKKYFSGGVNPGMAANPVMTKDGAQLAKVLIPHSLVRFNVETNATFKDSAQLTPEEQALYREIIQISESVNGNIRVLYGYKNKRFPKLIDMEKMYVGVNFLKTGLEDLEERTEVRKTVVENELNAFILDGTHEDTKEEIVAKRVLIYWIKEKWEILDKAMSTRQKQWEVDFDARLRELFMLLREHRETKDNELLSGVSVQIGPTKQELAKFLDLSEENISFQDLFDHWLVDGVPDQELQEQHEVDLLKHNYLHGYFAYNFLLIAYENEDPEKLLWLKNKYYQSVLLRSQSVSIDPTLYYDPQNALKSFIDKNPEIIEYQQQNKIENHAMASTSDLLDIADRISRINILIDEVILDGINSSEQRRLLELTQERAELIGALNKLKENGNDNKRIAEVNTAVLKEGILAIINNWMAAGKRRFNLTKNYYTEKISQSNDDEVVLLYVGEKYNPAGILLGFLEDNHWVIEIVEVEKSETGGGSGDLLVRKFIEQYGQDLMIELDIDYIGNNTSGLHNWRQKLKNLGFYGTETQLYKQPTNPIESGVNNIRAYEYPIAMQSSKNHITVADILISQLRRGLVLRKEFKQRIHEDLDGIVLENNEDPKKMQEIVRQLIASEYESSKNDYERLKREYESSLFINPSDITLDQLKKLKKYYLSLEQMLQSDKSLLDLFLKIEGKDNAQSAEYGGIDLKATADNIAIKKENADSGMQMNVDPVMIEKIKREGIQSLRPVIFSITPVVDVWKMIGLTPPMSSGSTPLILK